MNHIRTLENIKSRQDLSNLKLDPNLGIGVELVYLYFLNDCTLQYPEGKSNILYIGEAQRISEPSAIRFRQHISPGKTIGSDTGNNLILSHYFHANWDMGLSIFSVEEDRKAIERNLIYAHINKYGSPPIAQGKIPCAPNGRNRISHIYQFINSNMDDIQQGLDVIDGIIGQLKP